MSMPSQAGQPEFVHVRRSWFGRSGLAAAVRTADSGARLELDAGVHAWPVEFTADRHLQLRSGGAEALIQGGVTVAASLSLDGFRLNHLGAVVFRVVSIGG